MTDLVCICFTTSPIEPTLLQDKVTIEQLQSSSNLKVIFNVVSEHIHVYIYTKCSSDLLNIAIMIVLTQRESIFVPLHGLNYKAKIFPLSLHAVCFSVFWNSFSTQYIQQ